MPEITIEHWIEKRRRDDAWRHPSDLSVLAWLFAGEGASLTWSAGRVSRTSDHVDLPYALQIEDAFLAVPEGLTPEAASLLSAAGYAADRLKDSELHPLDRCLNPRFLASRVPPGVDPEYAAGLMVACTYLSRLADLVPPHGRTRDDAVKALVFSAAGSAVAVSLRGQAAAAQACIRDLSRRAVTARREAAVEPDLIFEDSES